MNDSKADVEDLAAWLTRVWDEEERRLTRTTNQGTWVADGLSVRHQPTGDTLARFVYPGDADHAERWQPSAVLARIAADRKILAMHTGPHECPSEDDGCGWWMPGDAVFEGDSDVLTPGPYCPTVRLLASPYRGRGGWKESWAL